MDVDRSTFEAKLLEHAERQTKSLERIDFIVLAMFLIGLVATALWLVAFFAA